MFAWDKFDFLKHVSKLNQTFHLQSLRREYAENAICWRVLFIYLFIFFRSYLCTKSQFHSSFRRLHNAERLIRLKETLHHSSTLLYLENLFHARL